MVRPTRTRTRYVVDDARLRVAEFGAEAAGDDVDFRHGIRADDQVAGVQVGDVSQREGRAVGDDLGAQSGRREKHPDENGC